MMLVDLFHHHAFDSPEVHINHSWPGHLVFPAKTAQNGHPAVSKSDLRHVVELRGSVSSTHSGPDSAGVAKRR